MASKNPLSSSMQALVVRETAARIRQAATHFECEFPEIPVVFDLRGKAAGMYRVRASERVIRYNPHIFARYFDDNLDQTVPHEVAHYVSDLLYGLRKIRPHGPEWKQVMAVFGARPVATCNYDLEGLPQRRYQQYTYRCGCREHQLTTIRHNRVRQRRTSYFCRQCGTELRFVAGR